MLPELEIPDVDLDVKDRDAAITALRNYIQASQVNGGVLTPHNTGVYFQKVPEDPITGLSAFPYTHAEEIGYFKVDIIPNHVYDLVESNEDLQSLLDAPIDWGWFQDKRFFEAEDRRFQLTHLAGYHHLCEMYPPQSVEDVACLLALIRPSKRHLVGESWEEVKRQVWVRPAGDEYFFKKSHSVAFAVLVVLHAQLIARHLGEAEEYFL